MMTETVQREYAQDAMPDFEELMKLAEGREKGQIREQKFTENREIHTREEKRDAELRERIGHRHLSRRRRRRMNLDETYRTPSLFTWRY